VGAVKQIRKSDQGASVCGSSLAVRESETSNRVETFPHQKQRFRNCNRKHIDLELRMGVNNAGAESRVAPR
jgi:hypothetical protein